MTGPVEEHSYRRPRRYVFAVTLAVIIITLYVLWLVV
jgi:hypothetical protein